MVTSQQDYYETLGVPRDADSKAIKDAFRELAMRYHPDRCKEPGAEERFKQITEAYAVLSDPKKRGEYDRGGFAGVAGYSPEDLLGGIDFGDIFSGHGFDVGFDFGGGFFDRLFGGGRRRGPRHGPHIELELEIPLEKVLSGGEETVRYTRPVICESCHGSGAKAGTSPTPCEACHGTGQHSTTQRREGITFHQVVTCSTCQGRGQTIGSPCPDCTGRGTIERAEEIQLRIPAGIEDGMALRVPGRGHPSSEPGVEPGDLLVIVTAAPDPRFSRRGTQLWRSEILSIPDAVLGAAIQVPTLDGEVSVTVPPGTQSGTILRVRERGLPQFGGEHRGDLLLAIELRVPEQLSRDERKLYQQLRALNRHKS